MGAIFAAGAHPLRRRYALLSAITGIALGTGLAVNADAVAEEPSSSARVSSTAASSRVLETSASWDFESAEQANGWVVRGGRMAWGQVGHESDHSLQMRNVTGTPRMVMRASTARTPNFTRHKATATVMVQATQPGELVRVVLAQRARGTNAVLATNSRTVQLPDTEWHPVSVTLHASAPESLTQVRIINRQSERDVRVRADGLHLEWDRVCGAAGKFAPRCGARWGIYSVQDDDLVRSVTNIEEQTGREFDWTMRYHDFSQHPHLGKFPDAAERTLGETRTLVVAWQARIATDNVELRWADIARGDYDESVIVPAAQRVAAHGKPIVIAFDPEFDNITSKRGTVAEYIAAYRHIHRVFAQQGVTNVAWAWIPTGYIKAGNDAKIKAGYPGDAFVDWVGFDRYNFYKCNGTPWRSFEETFAETYRWMISQGYGTDPFMLGEYGTQFDSADPARSRAWYASIPATLAAYPNLKALIRFDSAGVFSNTGKVCGFELDNGPGMIDAFAGAGRDNYVRAE